MKFNDKHNIKHILQNLYYNIFKYIVNLALLLIYTVKNDCSKLHTMLCNLIPHMLWSFTTITENNELSLVQCILIQKMEPNFIVHIWYN